MIRAFAALALPEAVRLDLMLTGEGLPVPRTVPSENLHLTLVFLGELHERRVEDIDIAFRQVRAPRFELSLGGLGLFGGARPRIAYVGVHDCPSLRHLQAKVQTAARSAGYDAPGRRFVPHVTLARLPDRQERQERLERAVAAGAGYRAPKFEVEDFRLFRSHLGSEGAIYEELARYPLG